ncbi:11071_t:CDS:2, partial [Racocetra fulgida]
SGIVCSTYDASEAHKFCSEIDPTWQPILKNPNVLVDLSSNTIKHNYLSEYNRARLDLLAYIIVTRVIPGQVDRLQQLRDAIEQASNTASELLSQDDIPQDDILTQDNVLPQDDVLSVLPQDDILSQNDELSQDDIPQDDILTQDNVLLQDDLSQDITLTLDTAIENE